MKVYPPMILKVLVDEITAFPSGRNKDLAGIAGRVLKATSMEVGKKGPKLSITERGEEGDSKVVASCIYLEGKFQECSIREEVGLATSVEKEGVDLSTRTRSIWEQRRRRVGKSAMYMWMGQVAASRWRGQAVGISPTVRLEVEAACVWADGEEITRKCEGRRSLQRKTWRQVRGPVGAVMCETRDLGIKGPQRHT